MTDRPASTIGFIGAGRVARALSSLWARAGIPVVAVASRSRASADALAERASGCVTCDRPQEVAERCDLVFVTVPDDAIPAAIRGVRFRPDSAVVHCSGACELDVLGAARDQGARVGGFHPLQLFGSAETSLTSLAGCSIAIEAEPPLRQTLAALADVLGCRVLTLPPGARVLYHAGANYAASFVLCLLDEATRIWGRAGIGPETTLAALMPLLNGTIASAGRNGLAGSLAGPVSRGDLQTLRRHIEAIAALGGDHLALYTALTKRAVELARHRGADEAKLAEIERLIARAADAG